MGRNAPPEEGPAVPFPFESSADLLDRAAEANLSIAGVMAANERSRMSEEAMNAGLDRIFAAMEACIDRGMRQDGVLPGGLTVKRRARQIHQTIQGRMERQMSDPLAAMDFVNLWAMAVNEENAAGGRVVTAPTNGAAGLVPAVLRFFVRFHKGTPEQVRTFLLTAAAIGALYKMNASISGAEVGCQGEVGVACSMAAAGLAAALGGTNAQIENAAEMAWSTIWASPAIRSAAWCKSPASSATPWARSRPSTPRAWPCWATVSIRCRSTRSSPR